MCCSEWTWNFGVWGGDSVKYPAAVDFNSAGLWKLTLSVTDGNCVMTDIDTVWTINDIGIDEANTSNNLSIHPNPTTGTFTVQGPSLNSRVNATGEIQVYDLFGRWVFRTNEQQVDMSHQPKGVYVVRVGNVVRKLIVH